MAKKRGRSGVIRGLPARTVEQVIQRLVELFEPMGGFTRAQVYTALDNTGDYTPEQIEGLTDQLELAAGPRGDADGFHAFPKHMKTLAKHRAFRLNTGRFNLADTILLLRCLEVRQQTEHLTPGLEKLQNRAQEALKHIRVDWRADDQ